MDDFCIIINEEGVTHYGDGVVHFSRSCVGGEFTRSKMKVVYDNPHLDISAEMGIAHRSKVLSGNDGPTEGFFVVFKPKVLK